MSQSDATRVVRAGLPEPEQGQPFMPGPVFAGPFHLQGEVVLFASGMAAASALLLTALAA